jgi:hypothetical protein
MTALAPDASTPSQVSGLVSLTNRLASPDACRGLVLVLVKAEVLRFGRVAAAVVKVSAKVFLRT